VLRYMAHWNTELTHILFLITTILILGILEVGHMDNTAIFSYNAHGISFSITVYHLLVATIFLIITAVLWMEYKREQLERIIEEIVPKNH
jgi:hypothetical protein